MSMKTVIVYGYGVDLWDIDIPDREHMIKFMKKHEPLPHTKNEYDSFLREISDDDCEDVSNYYEAFCTCEDAMGNMEGWSFIADVIIAESGLMFSCEYGEDQAALMIPTCLPWEANSNEKNITKDDVDKMLKCYFEELGCDAGILHRIGCVEVEYCG